MANTTENNALILSFCEITSSTREEATFFLESHQWDLDAAVSTFLDNNTTVNNDNLIDNAASLPPATDVGGNSYSPSASPSESHSPNYSPSQSPSRSRSRSPSPAASRVPYQLRSRREKKADKAAASGSASRTRGLIRTLADLNQTPENKSGSDDDDDEPQQYYTGGEKSGMLVQDPTKHFDADSIFEQTRQAGAVERPAENFWPSSSRNFTGTGRLLSGNTVSSAPQPPEAVTHTIILWRNGFTIDDGPLRRFDDPVNASFLESIQKSECPKELEPADRRTQVHLDLMRHDGNYTEPVRPKAPFQGVGRTLGSSSTTASEQAVPDSSFMAAPSPAMGLIIDPSLPMTSIQLRLADGTRMVSRFNLHHTIRDIRGFIEASRPGGARNYQLQTMGFPPKQLTDPDQTIENAGIASCVIIQKF